MSNYTNEDHRAAVAEIFDAQARRFDAMVPALDDGPLAGLVEVVDVIEEDDRAVESMAPENTGRPRHRAQSVQTRADLAARADRSVVRRRLLTDGEIRNPVELARAMGQHVPNRAARRAAAKRKGNR